jgi:large subunit ribosomal protein L13
MRKTIAQKNKELTVGPSNAGNYTIDAQGKKIGRVATEAAAILIGKNTTTFVRNAHPDVKVVITNASKADISEKKKEQKQNYKSYSGYPGGLRIQSLGLVIEKKGAKEAFRVAVKGMLPKNKLQTRMLKNLTITD